MSWLLGESIYPRSAQVSSHKEVFNRDMQITIITCASHGIFYEMRDRMDVSDSEHKQITRAMYASFLAAFKELI